MQRVDQGMSLFCVFVTKWLCRRRLSPPVARLGSSLPFGEAPDNHITDVEFFPSLSMRRKRNRWDILPMVPRTGKPVGCSQHQQALHKVDRHSGRILLGLSSVIIYLLKHFVAAEKIRRARGKVLGRASFGPSPRLGIPRQPLVTFSLFLSFSLSS